MEVDRSAPAVAEAATEIAADPETVWEVLTDLERWPSWNPDVSAVAHEGGLEEGATFRWKAGRATITSTIREVDRPRLIGWTGRTTGIDAIHVWRLDLRDGGTLVRTEESWQGLLVRVIRGSMQKSLQKAVDGGLAHLKAESERRARTGS
ncbi:MAG: SRPBCC family protein [Gaiellaceae bacterium]